LQTPKHSLHPQLKPSLGLSVVALAKRIGSITISIIIVIMGGKLIGESNLTSDNGVFEVSFSSFLLQADEARRITKAIMLKLRVEKFFLFIKNIYLINRNKVDAPFAKNKI
jgi:hypothetical protein